MKPTNRVKKTPGPEDLGIWVDTIIVNPIKKHPYKVNREVWEYVKRNRGKGRSVLAKEVREKFGVFLSENTIYRILKGEYDQFFSKSEEKLEELLEANPRGYPFPTVKLKYLIIKAAAIWRAGYYKGRGSMYSPSDSQLTEIVNDLLEDEGVRTALSWPQATIKGTAAGAKVVGSAFKKIARSTINKFRNEIVSETLRHYIDPEKVEKLYYGDIKPLEKIKVGDQEFDAKEIFKVLYKGPREPKNKEFIEVARETGVPSDVLREREKKEENVKKALQQTEAIPTSAFLGASVFYIHPAVQEQAAKMVEAVKKAREEARKKEKKEKTKKSKVEVKEKKTEKRAPKKEEKPKPKKKVKKVIYLVAKLNKQTGKPTDILDIGRLIEDPKVRNAFLSNENLIALEQALKKPIDLEPVLYALKEVYKIDLDELWPENKKRAFKVEVTLPSGLKLPRAPEPEKVKSETWCYAVETKKFRNAIEEYNQAQGGSLAAGTNLINAKEDVEMIGEANVEGFVLASGEQLSMSEVLSSDDAFFKIAEGLLAPILGENPATIARRLRTSGARASEIAKAVRALQIQALSDAIDVAVEAKKNGLSYLPCSAPGALKNQIKLSYTASVKNEATGEHERVKVKGGWASPGVLAKWINACWVWEKLHSAGIPIPVTAVAFERRTKRPGVKFITGRQAAVIVRSVPQLLEKYNAYRRMVGLPETKSVQYALTKAVGALAGKSQAELEAEARAKWEKESFDVAKNTLQSYKASYNQLQDVFSDIRQWYATQAPAELKQGRGALFRAMWAPEQGYFATHPGAKEKFIQGVVAGRTLFDYDEARKAGLPALAAGYEDNPYVVEAPSRRLSTFLAAVDEEMEDNPWKFGVGEGLKAEGKSIALTVAGFAGTALAVNVVQNLLGDKFLAEKKGLRYALLAGGIFALAAFLGAKEMLPKEMVNSIKSASALLAVLGLVGEFAPSILQWVGLPGVTDETATVLAYGSEEMPALSANESPTVEPEVEVIKGTEEVDVERSYASYAAGNEVIVAEAGIGEIINPGEKPGGGGVSVVPVQTKTGGVISGASPVGEEEVAEVYAEGVLDDVNIDLPESFQFAAGDDDLTIE